MSPSPARPGCSTAWLTPCMLAVTSPDSSGPTSIGCVVSSSSTTNAISATAPGDVGHFLEFVAETERSRSTAWKSPTALRFLCRDILGRDVRELPGPDPSAADRFCRAAAFACLPAHRSLRCYLHRPHAGQPSSRGTNGHHGGRGVRLDRKKLQRQDRWNSWATEGTTRTRRTGRHLHFDSGGER